MRIASEQNNELIVSRIIDELANTYYEMGKLDEAEQAFRDLLQRFIDFCRLFLASVFFSIDICRIRFFDIVCSRSYLLRRHFTHSSFHNCGLHWF